MVLCDVLACINCFWNNSNNDALARMVLQHRSPAKIAEAKKWLVQEFLDHVSGTSYLTDRHNSTTRLAHEAEIDDILSIFDILDAKQALDAYVFATSL